MAVAVRGLSLAARSDCPVVPGRVWGTVPRGVPARRVRGTVPGWRFAQCGRLPPARATATPIAPASEQRRHDAAAEDEQEHGRAGEHRVLPRLGQGARERHRGSEDRAGGGRPRAAEEGLRPVAVAQALEPAGAEQHEGERRRERDERREQPAAEAVRPVTHRGDGVDDRARRDLAERDRVQELARGEPVVPVHRVRLHQRHDHEAPAVGERADLERHPGERRQAAHRSRDRQRPDPEQPPAAGAQRQLDEPAPDQHEHEPRPDRRRRDSPCEQVDDPPRHAPRAPARVRHEAPARLHARPQPPLRPHRRLPPGSTAAASSRGRAPRARGSRPGRGG